MDFGEMAGKAEELAKEHPDQVEGAAQKAGDAAGERFGHQEQIDEGVDKFKDWVPGGEGGDTPAPPPAEGEQPPPAPLP